MEVKVTDKRGQHGRTSHKPDASQGDSELASTGPASQEPQAKLKKGKEAPGEGEPAALEVAPLESFVAEVDNLSLGQAFWVRGVEYRVIEVLKDGLKIIPISLDRQTLKRLRRLQREANQHHKSRG